MDMRITQKLRVIGKESEIAKFTELIAPYKGGALQVFENYQEPHIRKIIQNILDTHSLAIDVMYDGNTVYGSKKILKQFRLLVKNYKFEHFTDTLYKFFSLRCGSIAHFNRLGWYETYPTLDSLKSFFRCNEYGHPVLSNQPGWSVDSINIILEMNKILKIKN